MRYIKILTLTLILILVPTATNTPYTYAKVDDTKVEIKIIPTMVDIIVPLETSFVIGDECIYPDMDIINNSKAPIYISSRITGSPTTLPILPPNTHSDWDNLSVEDTAKGIALGIIDKKNMTQTSWLSPTEEVSWGMINPKSTGTYNLTTLHGKKWVENVNMEYTMVIKVSLTEEG